MNIWSIFFWLLISWSFKLLKIIELIFSTAFKTLLPKNKFLFSSLSSYASNEPVEAPDGVIDVAEIL